MQKSITLEEQLEILFSKAKKLEAIDPLQAIGQAEKALELATQGEETLFQIDCLLFLGQLNRVKGDFYKSLSQLKRALKLTNTYYSEDAFKMAMVYKELGGIHADGIIDYKLALSYFFKALQYNIPSLNCRLYNNIGSVYKDIGQFDKAIQYLRKGETMALVEQDYFPLAFIMENLGIIYQVQKAYKTAEKCLLRGLDIAEKGILANEPYHYIKCIILNSLGNCRLSMGQGKQAYQHFERALELASEREFKSIVCDSLLAMGNYCFLQKEEKRFLEIYREALGFAKDNDLFSHKQDCLGRLRDFFESQNDFEMAYAMAKEIIANNRTRDAQSLHKNMVEILNEREAEILVLEEKNKMISLQKEELEQFAHIVAHDLKEPLRNMGNYSGLLKKRYGKLLDAHGQEFLDFIVNNTEHMYTMLEELLTFTNLQNNTTAIGLVDAHRLLYSILEQIKETIKKAKAIVEYENLPLINIRGIHLEMLFQNLIHNALKFRKPDQICLISISAQDEEDTFCFQIKDNGIGIAKAYHQRVFQLFKRLDKHNYRGTGMGLAICKKIVEIYGGEIWVESEEGQGSTFCFRLPKKKEPTLGSVHGILEC